MKKSQWLNIAGLLVGFASLFYEILTPFWGVVFLHWVYLSLKDEKAFLFSEVSKKETGLIYWLMIVLWSLFGLYLLFYPWLYY